MGYHGRPPSEATAAPKKIDTAPKKIDSEVPSATAANAGRRAFDDFQRKWDKFDSDEYLSGLERGLVTSTPALDSRVKDPESKCGNSQKSAAVAPSASARCPGETFPPLAWVPECVH